jgi:hypothetical protein
MQQLQHLCISSITTTGLPVLLAAIQGMQQLQHLELQGENKQLEPLQGGKMQQYAALTASSNLKRLLFVCDEHLLADGAVQYMFAEGKHLPQLMQLRIGRCDEEEEEDEWSAFNASQPLQLFGPGDLARLAVACPALQQLWALSCMQPAADVSSLALLTAVKQLKVGGCGGEGAIGAAALSAALSQMSQLQDLRVVEVPMFGAAELAALTRLTRLTRLRVEAGSNQRVLGRWEVVFLKSQVKMSMTG